VLRIAQLEELLTAVMTQQQEQSTRKIKETYAYSVDKLREQREKELKIAQDNTKKRSSEADEAFKRDLLKYKSQVPKVEPVAKPEAKPAQKTIVKLENIVLEHDPVALDKFLDDEPKVENPPDANEPQAYGSFLENESEDPLSASKSNDSSLHTDASINNPVTEPNTEPTVESEEPKKIITTNFFN